VGFAEYNKVSEDFMIDKAQLRSLITKVLKEANLYSESAVELLMLTAAVESKLGTYIKQLGGGPALGIFQMEPLTEQDIHGHFLAYREGLEDIVDSFSTMQPDELEWNLAYQILMARLHYLRVPEPLPDKDDVEGLAKYWKKYYNTNLGKGTVEKAVRAYRSCCLEYKGYLA